MVSGRKLIGIRTITIYFILLLAVSTLTTTVMLVGVGLYDDVIWLTGGGPYENLIVDRNSRTIYSSRVSANLYESLARDPDIQYAYPISLALAVLNDETIVIRGLHPDDIIKLYGDRIIDGSIGSAGSTAIIGYRVASRHDLNLGDILYISSVNAPRAILLEVVGIYETGELWDYEIITSIDNVRRLTAQAPDTYTAIVIEGEYMLDKFLDELYILKINFPRAVDGSLILSDALGRIYKSVKLRDQTSINIELPYGYYNIYLKTHHLTSKLGDIFVKNNLTLNIDLHERVNLTIRAAEGVTIKLYDMDGVEIPMSGENHYILPPGTYIVDVNNRSFPVTLISDATLDLTERVSIKLYTLVITVTDNLGREINNYYLTIKDKYGDIIYSTESKRSILKIQLSEGEYEIAVSVGYIISKETVNIMGNSELKIRVPIHLTELGGSIIRELRSAWQAKNVDVASASLELIVGVTLGYYITLILLISILSSIVFIYIHRLYYEGTRKMVAALKNLNYRLGEIISYLATYPLMAILAAIPSSYPLGILIYKWITDNYIISIFSYGLPKPNNIAIVPALLIAIITWVMATYDEINRIRR